MENNVYETVTFAKQSFLGDSEPPVNHHSNPNASSSLVISQTVSTKQPETGNDIKCQVVAGVRRPLATFRK